MILIRVRDRGAYDRIDCRPLRRKPASGATDHVGIISRLSPTFFVELSVGVPLRALYISVKVPSRALDISVKVPSQVLGMAAGVPSQADSEAP